MKEKGKSVVKIADVVEMSSVSIWKILSKVAVCEESGIDPVTIIKKYRRKVGDNTEIIQQVSEIVQFDNALTQRLMKSKLQEVNVICSQSKI
jgi:hypothetical protein